MCKNPSILPHIRAFLLVVAGAVTCSCSSAKKDDSSAISGRNPESLSSRINAKPSYDKRSMYDSAGDSGDMKQYKTGLFGGKKEYKTPEFRGSKLFKTGQYAEGAQRSPWAGMTSRENAQEVPGNLRGDYSTGTSRYSGQSSRDDGTVYETGTYRTGGNIIGNRAIGNARPPKIIPSGNTSGGMSESEIQSLLKKN